MKRTIVDEIVQSSENKIILITGPRQSGKTTLSKSLSVSVEYLNYDSRAHRLKILAEKWDESQEYLVLDEIHKMKKWKLWLKGLFDTNRNQKIIVTDSARLDTHKKVGDSMAGRYFLYHLFPFDLKELKENNFGSLHHNFERLMSYSGFPEPFLKGSHSFYGKWKKAHLDIIVKQDLVELETVRRIGDIETLIELMNEKISSILSYSSLREDLSTDDKTIKRWLTMLENNYVFFKILPYFKSIKDSIRKAPKYYFYDFPRVQEYGARLENFVAFSLWKELHLRNDIEGKNYSLHFLRNKRKCEIDFLVCLDKKPLVMIEVKKGDHSVSENFEIFYPQLKKDNPKLKRVQLVQVLKREFISRDGVEVMGLPKWLEAMPF